MIDISCAWKFVTLNCLTVVCGWSSEPNVVSVPECRVKFVDQAILASERSGIVAQIAVREGDAVRVGERLLLLNDDLPKAQLATLTFQAESRDSGARIQDALLAENFAVGRYKIALAAIKKNPDAVSVAEELELKTAADRAKTEVQQAKLELDLVKLRKKELEAELRLYSVLAPFSGIVTRVMKSRGEAVQLGDPVAELVDPTRLKVEGYVNRTHVKHLKPGQVVDVFEGSDDATAENLVQLSGRLVFVDVGVEPVSQRIRIWAEVDNTERRLRPGVLARMEIQLSSVAEAKPNE